MDLASLNSFASTGKVILIHLRFLQKQNWMWPQMLQAIK